MEPYWEFVKQIIRESDIILEILDARMPELSRNKVLEKIIREAGKPKIIVINKADLVSRRELELALEKLMGEQEPRTAIVYVSNRQPKTIKNLIAKIRQVFNKYGKIQDSFAKPVIKKPYREAKGDIIVGVVGYPNVGKSSIINALAFKKKAKVSSKAGTTHGVHWIRATKEIKLIDTPGVIPLEYTEETKLALIAARSPEKLKDPEVVCGKIIELFIKKNKLEKIEKFYDVKLEDEKDPYAIITKIAIQKKHLKKGGVPDEIRTVMMIIRDWQNGKLKL